MKMKLNDLQSRMISGEINAAKTVVSGMGVFVRVGSGEIAVDFYIKGPMGSSCRVVFPISALRNAYKEKSSLIRDKKNHAFLPLDGWEECE